MGRITAPPPRLPPACVVTWSQADGTGGAAEARDPGVPGAWHMESVSRSVRFASASLDFLSAFSGVCAFMQHDGKERKFLRYWQDFLFSLLLLATTPNDCFC